MGPGPSDAKEGRSLNRVVRWLDGRIEYEADPRQSERLISECGFDGSKGVATPGVKSTFTELEADTELSAKTHTAFRGPAVRATTSQLIGLTRSSLARRFAGGCRVPPSMPGKP